MLLAEILTFLAFAATPVVTYAPEPPLAVAPTPAAELPPLLRATIEADAAQTIQRGCEPLVWRHRGKAPRGALILMHGYSAGTWQFDALGPMLHREGFDVYAPRMPGHGFGPSGAEEDAGKLLKSGEWPNYRDFAERVYQETKELGGPISVMGISGGANVLLAMMASHPDIARAVVVAPFMWPKNGYAAFAISVVQGVDTVTGSWGGSWLDGMDFSWGEAFRPKARAWGRPGHWDMKAGNVFALMRFGQSVLGEAERIRTPMQIVATGDDDVAAEGPIRELHRKVGGPEKHAFYFFPKEERVVHPMIHFRENPDSKSLATVTEIIRGYLVEGKRFDR
ncbi:MAG: alpha/beta fold hydrolase [Candidatus Sericytochromatia bacterium]|uniref:Alpha/beta fold hydrolase n=1 Tax=Candidatus Tanganyikabacteria bacterium TaxID=2961651 RepID=A0A938BJS7_9BACT|nr:alpha/beta fold hydrolase [Candidatus Tanganyikabacteria bacterium]